MRVVLRMLPGVVLDAAVGALLGLAAGLVQVGRRLVAWWRRSFGRRATIAVGVATVLAVASILVVDRPVAEAFRHLDPDLRAIAELVTQFGDSAGYIVAGVVLTVLLWWVERSNPALGARWRLGLWTRRAAFFAATVIASGLLSILLKNLFGRPRPRMWFHEELFAFQPFTFDTSANFASFPSGHATTAWAVAFALVLIFGRRAWVLLPVALVVSTTRVLLTNHYIGDVIGGAILGGLTALALAPLFGIGDRRPR